MQMAKGNSGGSKKRRRRKTTDLTNDVIATNPPPSTIIGGDSVNDDSNSDELPDFDLVEDIDLQDAISFSEETSSSTTTPGTKTNISKKAVSALDVNDPKVIEAMKPTASGGFTASSTKDLLRSRNRELEKQFVMDEVTEAVPSLADYNQRKVGGKIRDGKPAIGKKAARAEARRQAAIQAEETENNDTGLFSNFPFGRGKDGFKEDVSLIKLLENATWAGIFILVAWEIFINSPFFERAAPMAPVVFTTPDTMLYLGDLIDFF